MARRRYYKPYRRSYSKKKWATCMKYGRLLFSVQSGGQTGHAEDVLVANSTQAATPTPVIVKTGNFKIQGDCFVSGNGSNVQDTTSITLYVMYLPEVVVSSANVITTVQDHPEWILAWKVIDINPGTTTSNSSSFTFSSRLKRNLNSGDTIALVAIARETNSFTPSVSIQYTCQYWTCSN